VSVRGTPRQDLVNTHAMKVVTTFHPSSSVLASCKWQLLDDARSEFLVVAKLNQLDFYSLQPEGLKYEDGLEIRGRVRAVRVVPIKVRLLGSPLAAVQGDDIESL